MSESNNAQQSTKTWLVGVLAGAAVLVLLFAASFESGWVHFSNDGPLGRQVSEVNDMPEGFTGFWNDQNWLGSWEANANPSLTYLFMMLVGPINYAKFYPMIACAVLGLAVGFCLRRLKLHPAVAVIGGLAAALNGDFFSYACWGLGSLTLAVAFFFLGIAAIGDGTGRHPWVRLPLAGAAIGMSVMEGFDNGAIFSLFFAAYVVWTFLIQGKQLPGVRFSKGVGAVAIVAIAAGLTAASAMYGLISTQVRGVAMFEEANLTPTQQEQAEQAQWQFATQWSLPKKETVRLFAAGVFGYRMDSPDGRAYWGAIGRSTDFDAYLEGRTNAPSGIARFSGAGFYAGVPVCLIALWAVVRSFSRKDKTTFTPDERKFIWFWAVMALVSLLLSWGRHAPFYQLFYQLPYFSTIRNPVKFLHPLSFSLIFLFAYGLQGIWRAYLSGEDKLPASLKERWKQWWKSAPAGDRRWVTGLGVFVGACLLGLLMFAGSRGELVRHLERTGFSAAAGDPAVAPETIFSGSVSEAAWSFGFIGATVLVFCLILCGAFRGGRAKFAFLIVGTLLVVDLGRANLPWVVHYNYEERYAERPLFDFLSENKLNGRVASNGAVLQQQLTWLSQRLENQQTLNAVGAMTQDMFRAYRVEWMQHQFPFYNIQSLDIVQEPRSTSENARYREALPETNLRAYVRRLRLTNTRYLLALGDPVLPALEEMKGNAPGTFQEVMRFDIEQVDGHPVPVASTNGPLALIEYTGVLPRVKLYSNWQVIPDLDQALSRLSGLSFDPATSVLVSTPIEAAPENAPEEAGDVSFESYSPKHLVLRANATAKSVLLLNDKFDPNWSVLVDGEPAELLRCNYLMRGVLLEPGEHVVEFRFEPPQAGLYLSLVAIAVALGVCGWLGFSGRSRKSGDTA